MEEETKDTYPYVSDGMLKYLKRTFPNQLPSKEVSAFELGQLMGIQYVIQHLEQVKQWSEEKNV